MTTIRRITGLVCLITLMSLYGVCHAQEEYQLVWADEFEIDGKPDSLYWNYETGFERNEELQWYQPENVCCRNGLLIIEARSERRENPLYDPQSKEWRKSRQYIECTSSSIKTSGKKEFLYGRLEVRARIPVAKGAWPAIWTLGTSMEWPSCGEIDVMEFYRRNGVPYILANAAWGTDRRWNAKWNTKMIPFEDFLRKNPDWASEFHVWRMDWDEEAIRIFIDNEPVNEILLKDTYNGSLGEGKNPFMQPHYILLNLAVGGTNGGPTTPEAFPIRYEVDYVRLYQKK